MSEGAPGIYGKLPALGDFVSLRLARSFTDPFDRFLQDGIGVSRDQLGAGWLDAYLVGPVWRFLIGPGACGPAAVAGVLMPSVDRVGRYFPLALASTLEDCANPPDVLAASTWYDALEHAALGTLAEEATLDTLEQRLAACGQPQRAVPLRASLAARAVGPGWIAVAGASAAHLPWAALCGLALAALPSYSLWWSREALLVHAGLPRAADYVALIEPQRAAASYTLLARARGDGGAPDAAPVHAPAPGVATGALAPGQDTDSARDLLDLLATRPPPRDG